MSSRPPAKQASSPTAAIAEVRTRSTLLTRGTFGYHTFRIPTLVTIPGNDRLLAFAEGRRDSTADTGRIDVVCCSSDDGGVTWSAPRVVSHAQDYTCGNPTPMVTASGRVVLLTTRNAAAVDEHTISRGRGGAAAADRRVFVQVSDDAGASFSPAREITAQVKDPQWAWYATGPVHGVTLRSGPYAGRLVAPCDHTVRPTPGAASDIVYGAHAILSDDEGESWRIGYVAQGAAPGRRLNEGTLAEVGDGLLYLNVRSQDPEGDRLPTRLEGRSADGGRTLVQPLRPCPQIHAPVCQAAVLGRPGRDGVCYLGPAGDRRSDLTLRFTPTGSQREMVELYRFAAAPAGYSDLALHGRDLALVWETGERSAYERIDFAILTPSPWED